MSSKLKKGNLDACTMSDQPAPFFTTEGLRTLVGILAGQPQERLSSIASATVTVQIGTLVECLTKTKPTTRKQPSTPGRNNRFIVLHQLIPKCKQFANSSAHVETKAVYANVRNDEDVVEILNSISESLHQEHKGEVVGSCLDKFGQTFHEYQCQRERNINRPKIAGSVGTYKLVEEIYNHIKSAASKQPEVVAKVKTPTTKPANKTIRKRALSLDHRSLAKRATAAASVAELKRSVDEPVRTSHPILQVHTNHVGVEAMDDEEDYEYETHEGEEEVVSCVSDNE